MNPKENKTHVIERTEQTFQATITTRPRTYNTERGQVTLFGARFTVGERSFLANVKIDPESPLASEIIRGREALVVGTEYIVKRDRIHKSRRIRLNSIQFAENYPTSLSP